ncbi:MAG: AMP-binding protein [Bacteroidales bacterium]|nr:AMP-binding protein [Bacteroidales bacterium]
MLKNHKKTAVIYKDLSVNYQELLQYIHCYSENFKQQPKYKKVIVFGENSLEWIYALYAAFTNESIAIPIDIQSTAGEITYIINDCQPDIIFTSEAKREFMKQIIDNMQLSIPILCSSDIDTHDVTSMPVVEFSPKNTQDTAVIIYTSGTTGSSKGVMLSYDNILFNIKAVCDEVPIITKERNTMILLPLHHIFPLLGSLIAPLYSGGTLYIADGLNSEAILHTLNTGKINLIIGVPRLYDTLAKGVLEKINAHFATKSIYKIAALIQNQNFSKFIFKTVHQKFGGHLEYLVSGGAALPKATAKIFKTLGFYVLEGYGMTETSPMISFTHPGKWKIGYAGLPLSGIELKTVDGEICVKGPNVMQGYYNRPEETASIIKDGWLYTGDIGIIDTYGIKLTGRLKEIIVTSNGKNITPDQLEFQLVNNSPYIKEAGIFMHENILQALIYPEMTEIRAKSIEDLPDLIKTAILNFNAQVSPYKRIKRFHIISEELPKTRLGKIQRFKLSNYIENKKIQQEQNESKSYSEEYTLLKAFIDKETGYIAGENDHFEIDLSMDSLTRVSLMAFIENTFGLVLKEEDLNELNTLAKLSSHIEQAQTTFNHHHSTNWKEILSAKIPAFKLPKSGLTNKGLTNLSKIVFNTIYRFSSDGIKNIPDEPCIIVANHQSALDGLFITSLMKHKLYSNTYFFAKEKHWKNILMKFMARKNNVILMDINKNVREALQKLSYVLKQGKNVIIFPEGTRSKTGMKDFKEAFAILSKELNIPVVPVVIYGSHRASYQRFKFPRYFAPVNVEFLPPVYPMREEDSTAFKNRIQSVFRSKLEEYRKRKERKN